MCCCVVLNCGCCDYVAVVVAAAVFWVRHFQRRSFALALSLQSSSRKIIIFGNPGGWVWSSSSWNDETGSLSFCYTWPPPPPSASTTGVLLQKGGLLLPLWPHNSTTREVGGCCYLLMFGGGAVNPSSPPSLSQLWAPNDPVPASSASRCKHFTRRKGRYTIQALGPRQPNERNKILPSSNFNLRASSSLMLRDVSRLEGGPIA